MAKKGQQTQLQTELNDDQEFAEFIQRDGLLCKICFFLHIL